MTSLEISFDATTVENVVFHNIMRDGILLRTVGLINLRWADYSAEETANSLGLNDIVWETTYDETPATLSCLVFYPYKMLHEIELRLRDDAITEYELN